MLLIFIFLFCHPTIRVAVLLELETISSCWTWYGTDIFFCIFNLTEQWESPCYQTLKQYQVAGLGMLLILIFLFLSPHYQSRRVIKLETISSCWTWYGIDFFCIFNLTEQWESPCYETIKQYQFAGLGIVPCYQTLKQYQVAGLGMLLILIFLFCHPTIRVAVLLNLKQYLVAGRGMVLIFSAFLTSPNNEGRLVIRQ